MNMNPVYALIMTCVAALVAVVVVVPKLEAQTSVAIQVVEE